MGKIAVTNTTQMTRVRFASPQAADRRLSFNVRGGVKARGGFYAWTPKSPAANDVAYFRSGRPPV